MSWRLMTAAVGLTMLVAAPGCDDDDGEGAGCGACDAAAEYCVHHGSDVSDEPGSYACEPLPASCGDAPTCDCLDGAEASSFDLAFCLEEGGCVESGGVLKVTCPGG